MKCIGRKSDGFMLSAFCTCLLLVISIMLMIVLKDAGWTMIFPIVLAIGLALSDLYFIVLFPTDLVFYDEEEKKVTVYTSRKKSVTISLSDIKKIDLEAPWDRACWKRLDITLNNGEVITTTGISKENTIIESLMEIKK